MRVIFFIPVLLATGVVASIESTSNLMGMVADSEIICKCLSFYLKLFIYIILEYEGGVMFKRIHLFSQIFKQNKLYFSIK